MSLPALLIVGFGIFWLAVVAWAFAMCVTAARADERRERELEWDQ